MTLYRPSVLCVMVAIPNLLEWGVMFVMGNSSQGSRFQITKLDIFQPTGFLIKLGIVSNAFLGTQPH